MKRILLIPATLLLLGLSYTSQAQVYMRYYKIVSDGVNIGNLTARKTMDGDTTLYSVTSDIIIDLVSKLHVESKLNATYVEGALLYASSTIFVDNNKIEHTTTERTDKGYTIDRNGHTYRSVETAPFSSARLYFEMPSDKVKVYSELDGKVRTLVKRDAKKFELEDRESPLNKSTYMYSSEEGLFSIEVNRPHLPKIKISQVREPVTPEAELKDKSSEQEPDGQ